MQCTSRGSCHFFSRLSLLCHPDPRAAVDVQLHLLRDKNPRTSPDCFAVPVPDCDPLSALSESRYCPLPHIYPGSPPSCRHDSPLLLSFCLPLHSSSSARNACHGRIHLQLDLPRQRRHPRPRVLLSLKGTPFLLVVCQRSPPPDTPDAHPSLLSHLVVCRSVRARAVRWRLRWKVHHRPWPDKHGCV